MQGQRGAFTSSLLLTLSLEKMTLASPSYLNTFSASALSSRLTLLGRTVSDRNNVRRGGGRGRELRVPHKCDVFCPVQVRGLRGEVRYAETAHFHVPPPSTCYTCGATQSRGTQCIECGGPVVAGDGSGHRVLLGAVRSIDEINHMRLTLGCADIGNWY